MRTGHCFRMEKAIIGTGDLVPRGQDRDRIARDFQPMDTAEVVTMDFSAMLWRGSWSAIDGKCRGSLYELSALPGVL